MARRSQQGRYKASPSMCAPSISQAFPTPPPYARWFQA
uniref:Uncharacterized protein n=1 Tax=Arundo donax TaxID=35708 RepID=A0A0A9A4X8_ARUDO